MTFGFGNRLALALLACGVMGGVLAELLRSPDRAAGYGGSGVFVLFAAAAYLAFELAARDPSVKDELKKAAWRHYVAALVGSGLVHLVVNACIALAR